MRPKREVEVATADLTSVLDQAGARYELVSHAHTETAIAEAKALGVSPAEVAKTLIVKTLSGYVRAVLPASERLDLSKLSALYGGTKKTVQLATEEDLKRDYPEFELGAAPGSAASPREAESGTARSVHVGSPTSRRCVCCL